MSRLAKAVKKHGGRRKVADKLDCSVEFVRLMLAGEKTPGLALALKIKEILGVPVSYWQDSAATRGDSPDPTP